MVVYSPSGEPSWLAITITDLYGDGVGELIIDRNGNLSGKIDTNSFWVSITRIGDLGIVDSVSISPNLRPPLQRGKS